MEKLSLLQNYLVEKLIEDKLLDVSNLIEAVSKICSEDQFNSILTEFISPIPEQTENKKLENRTVIISMRAIHTSIKNKLDAIKILKQYYDITLHAAKDLIDKTYEGNNVEISIPIKLKKVNTLGSELQKCGIDIYY